MNTKKVVMMISTILLFGALIIFSSVGVCEETSVNMLYVGGTGNGNYSSIQETINASNSGDTIYVYSGIYNETLEINKSISLTPGQCNVIFKNNDFPDYETTVEIIPDTETQIEFSSQAMNLNVSEPLNNTTTSNSSISFEGTVLNGYLNSMTLNNNAVSF